MVVDPIEEPMIHIHIPLEKFHMSACIKLPLVPPYIIREFVLETYHRRDLCLEEGLFAGLKKPMGPTTVAASMAVV